MGMESIRGGPNIGPIGDVQKTQKGEDGKIAAKAFPTVDQLKGELTPEARTSVNVDGINDMINNSIGDLKNGSGNTFSTAGAKNSVILASLTPPQGISPAAKALAEKLNNSVESSSLGAVAIATLSQSFSKRLN